MRRRTWISLVAVLAVLVLALPLMAEPVTETVTLNQPAKLVGKHLDAGTYRLVIDGDTVVVQKNKEVVAEVKGRWVDVPSKVRQTSVVTREGEIIEMRFRGRDQVLRFD
jgi:endonuclease YncB( thermonuclease family)